MTIIFRCATIHQRVFAIFTRHYADTSVLPARAGYVSRVFVIAFVHTTAAHATLKGKACEKKIYCVSEEVK